MSTITTRSGKGSPLTNSEVDSNFTNLNTDKLEDITGESIKDLSDVHSLMSPTDGQVLTWDNANTRWSSADSTGGVSDIVDDTTPQLGGDLDVNGKSIVSIANADINITPNGAGSVVIDGLSYPQSDGTNGQVLTTNGTGTLSFTTVSGGGGGNTTNVGWENNATISQDYTITTNNNMVSAGPVTVDTGYSVTVPSGSRWVIV